MKTLKHEQARYYLHIGHEYLSGSEQASLKRHLSECSTCQAYATELEALQTTLSRVMHARWDIPAPALATDSKIQTRLRRKIVQKRVLNLVGSLASGTVVLGLIVIIAAFFRSPEPLPVTPGSAVVPNPTFGGNITLLSYTMDQEKTATGDTLKLTLYWQSQTVMQTSYAVFIHLQDESGRLLAQGDALPVNGKHPTTDWKPGEIIEDQREIKLPTGLSRGEYKLILGWYNPNNGTRLNTNEGKDTIALAPVEIR